MKSVYDMALEYYTTGLWSESRIKMLVQAGKLTREEADVIVGKE